MMFGKLTMWMAENPVAAIGTSWTIGTAIAGVWWFWAQRQSASQIEFDVDARIIKPEGGPIVAEYALTLKNKGKVRTKLPSISLRVRSLNRGDPIEKFDKARLAFPHKLYELDNILSRQTDFDFTFLEPGITQVYRVTAEVPQTAMLLLVYGEFAYRKKWRHTAEKVVEVR